MKSLIFLGGIMISNTLISIIIPVYNCGMFLSQCVNSLLEQTYSNLEIILVDDGSKDDSGALCDEFAAKSEKIIVLHQPNSGVAKARQVGIQKAKGQYILFIDADDWMEQTYVENLMNLSLEYDCDIIISGYRRYTDQQYIETTQHFDNGYYDKENLKKKIYPSMLSATPFFTFGITPSMWGKLFKKEIATANLKALENQIFFGEDGCFVYSALLDCRSIYITDHSGYIYRHNETSVTHTFNPKLMADNLKLKNFYLELCKEKEWDMGSQFEEYMAYLCDFTITSALSSDNSPSAKELKQYINALFPKNIVRNKKFKQINLKRKIRFFLIKASKFAFLKKYLTSKR